MKIKVLITGFGGLLGNYLLANCPDNYRVWVGCHRFYQTNDRFKTNVNYFPIELTDPINLLKTINEINPEIIIHNAALSDVDQCELHKVYANQVNLVATKIIADYSNAHHSKLYFCSSSYVFDGNSYEFSENSITNPINYYGKLKLIAERYILKYVPSAVIVRLSTLYRKTYEPKSLIVSRNNFIDIIYQSSDSKTPIDLVTDCKRNFLEVNLAATTIWKLVTSNFCGIYHLIGSSCISYYDFGVMFCNENKLDTCIIRPMTYSVFFRNHVAHRAKILNLVSTKTI